ncbi:MAG TPA: peroxiredoxin [Tepidisphaeraceae bacterium]|jgi:peroxiredoxin
MPLNPGDTAPDFALMDQNFRKVKLSDLKGRTVVLLFYPMDFSPVCTQEHCGFGPAIGQIAPDAGTVVFGVNCDHPFSHAAFKKQYGIPYDLLSDPTRAMAKAYDMFSGLEPFNCAKRGTVVIGPDGRIRSWSEAGVDEVRTPESLVAVASA